MDQLLSFEADATAVNKVNGGIHVVASRQHLGSRQTETFMRSCVQTFIISSFNVHGDCLCRQRGFSGLHFSCQKGYTKILNMLLEVQSHCPDATHTHI